MALTYMWKDPGSQTGNCPGLLHDEDGNYYVVGVKLDADQMAEVQARSAENDAALADNETAVFVPAALLNKLREH